jgi:hypothetical protein
VVLALACGANRRGTRETGRTGSRLTGARLGVIGMVGDCLNTVCRPRRLGFNDLLY